MSLTAELTDGFCWATGIEDTFVPQVRPGMRALDEYELTQHYRFWREDLDRAADLGIQAIRWGIPWYRVQPKASAWDWRWVDDVLDYMVNVKGLTPILDLMHYGTPLWLDNSFINSGYPALVANYAGAVAARYKSLVRYYTPLNEPAINAEWCGERGDWPPYLSGDDGYVKVMLAVTKGIVLTVQALRAEQPEMQTVHVEALRNYWTADPAIAARVELYNNQQFLSTDLTTGQVTEQHPFFAYLLNYGATEHELRWFGDHAVHFDYLGANFYPWSYGELLERKNGALYWPRRRTSGAAIATVLTTAYARYQIPIMVTETSAKGSVAVRARWMDESIRAVHDLRAQGLPIVGYTWFPLFSMFDWYYRRQRRPLAHYLIHLGLYDTAFDEAGILQRHSTPLVERYRQHLHKLE
ncbi:MAG: family 1 glycosylhydrolase [Caldilineaceae bacterium]